MSSIVYTPSPTPTNPSEGEVYYDSTSKELKVYGNSSSFEKIHDETVKPHIVTKKLYPSYVASGTANKLLDGVTNHSGAFGTEQADGRMYYYTNIAGSKPIHDPRIGAHFGSQRYKVKSMQLLEQETGTHGKNVYTIDGREWMRAVEEKTLSINNNAHGNYLSVQDEDYVEIVGYFNNANFATYTFSGNQFEYMIDGGSFTSNTYGNVSVTTPLADRFVDAGGFVNLGINVSLGIHTLRIKYNTSGSGKIYAFDLIAQDTTSATTRSQVQIPAQTVVSFGKKRSISAETKHYNPFAFKTDGSTAWTAGNHNGTSLPIGTGSSHNIDVATSLGLEKWKHSSNYYYPYNGMRVVRWVDENGVVKTSVTCMPPNAKSIADSSSLTNANAKANASVANDNFRPTFEAHTTDVNEDNLHEVAKSFYFREFGNGSANGGTGATYADASMLHSSADNVAYVMDDGSTSFNGNDQLGSGVNVYSDSRTWYMTFIGTGLNLKHNDLDSRSANFSVDGISIHSGTYGSNPDYNKVQNLPYGTHVVKYEGTSNYHAFSETTFYQPKRPPIPEDACVLADYMVFADFVPIPTTDAGIQYISKGVRSVSASRDIFYDETDGHSFGFSPAQNDGSYFGQMVNINGAIDNATSVKFRLPAFGTNYMVRGYDFETRLALYVDEVDKDSASTKHDGNDYGSHGRLTTDLALGTYTFGANGAVGGSHSGIGSFEIVTPTHTSHHYQSFETPFLHELIGGDRSMEQTNLICSSDGKSWDEITRNVSYISNRCVAAKDSTNGWANSNEMWNMDKHRGTNYHIECGNKFWAITYEGWICLKDGVYSVIVPHLKSGGDGHNYIYINESQVIPAHEAGSNYTATMHLASHYFKRGDYVQVYDRFHGNTWSSFFIVKG